MINPMSVVKNVRTSYTDSYKISKREVQFENEDPAWIPYDTLLAMMNFEGDILNGELVVHLLWEMEKCRW